MCFFSDKPEERRTLGFKKFILKRFIYTILLVFAVISINFIIFMMMPGDPAKRLVDTNMIGRAEIIQLLREQWGFDLPLYVRYPKYLVNMLTGQFGYSYITGKPISLEVTERLSNTLLLVIPPEIVAVAVGIVIGALAASKRGRWLDNLSVTTSLTVYALPVFWIAMMLILIFSLNLGWLPSGHSQPDYWLMHPPTSIFESLGTRLMHLILPWTTLFLISFGSYVLLTRASVLEAITEDYVVTARAKGIKERTILFKHTLKNALLPIITEVAITFGFTLSGAIITEQVFLYPGLGWWIWNAIDRNDYPVLQTIFFLIGLCVIIANFVADITYGLIDPRIKYG
jgi:ABC-type dipeptide/oligopeptide/nickel transport system permease component